jgi:hypothetical protein
MYGDSPIGENHELGHVFGLRDGEGAENCSPAPTIMHCSGQMWPSSYPNAPLAPGDKQSVENHHPVLGSQQGGSSAGCGGKAFCG